MNSRGIEWLYKELPLWVARGIIPSSSVEKIKDYYGNFPVGNKNRFFIMVCSLAGAILIGLGVFSIFAHNWESLSHSLRAVLSITLLLVSQGLAFFVLQRHPGSQALREGSAVFLSLMVGVSLALICQTYHIPGEMGDFVLFWMLLIAPVMYLMRATIPAVMYVLGITIWAGQNHWGDPVLGLFFWPFLVMVGPYFYQTLRKDAGNLRILLLALAIGLGMSIIFGFMVRHLPSDYQLVFMTSTIVAFYYLGVGVFSGISTWWQMPFRLIGGGGVAFYMMFLSYRYAWRNFPASNGYVVPDGFMALVGITTCMGVVLLALSVLFLIGYYRRNYFSRVMFGVLPVMALLAILISYVSYDMAMGVFNTYVLAASLVRIVQGIRWGMLGRMNSGLFLLACLIIFRFFDSGMGFVVKGISFILIGVVFFVANIISMRQQRGEA